MTLRSMIGLARSMWTYRRPGRLHGLLALYRPFVPDGGLVFDIGAHLGDRTRAFRRLGARVVALEPQPALMRWLERFHGGDAGVVLVDRAAGAEPGRARLAISEMHPAVASLSTRWRAEVSDSHAGFAAVRWPHSIEVTVTTLDELVDRHGLPDFCKIDVEGHESEVLEGLSQPLPALSVEFVAGALHRARACIDRLSALGDYRYNAVAGEQREYLWSEWAEPETVRSWLAAGADGLRSGDLYAVHRPRGS
ncbi:FkbM family methyltransferase [Wenzhouxiangella sp. XN24]|uniref:FkbM family methyltransferase n=1 Tax=Wenzhouxiangella sp. XN24 TaxID=2713569 RepID=UPI0013EAB308|nr:FkbM family methyltransferase [Wenzhouxiangella sp. XN24]NGX17110.1 FkbM family methyltransferase [Wenzhouxiangella sp. XN24]